MSRRGLDIATAIALGADFTLVGRATLYGAGAGGTAGVERALDILISEFKGALGQLGCNVVACLRAVELQRRRP